MDRCELLRRYLERQGLKALPGSTDLITCGYDGEIGIWFNHASDGTQGFFTIPWNLNEFIDDLIEEMQ